MKAKKKDKKEKKRTKETEKGHVQLHRSLNVKMMLNKEGNTKSSILTQLQDKMKGSKFRWINEQLYTQSGDKSLEMIQKDSSLFDIYHQGFREQVRRWPLVPVDVFITMLKKLPRKEVGDFGCGDGKIYKECKNHNVHCFDLVSREDFIIACDIAHVPLDNNCLDIAIFCLALMGTNWSDFIVESNRCLKPNGLLWIAEVRSRIDGEETGGEAGFIGSIEKLGFRLLRKKTDNSHFGLFFFKKIGTASIEKAKSIPSLKACIYKKR